MWQLQQRAPSTKRLACDGIWPRAATDHVTEVVVDSMSRLRMYEVARAVSRRCQFSVSSFIERHKKAIRIHLHSP